MARLSTLLTENNHETVQAEYHAADMARSRGAVIFLVTSSPEPGDVRIYGSDFV